MPEEVTEYRLSWEMPDPHWAAQYPSVYDFSNVWEYIPWPNNPTVKVTTEHSVLNQYRMLKRWSATKEQPIRNVTIEWRRYTPTEWEPYQL